MILNLGKFTGEKFAQLKSKFEDGTKNLGKMSGQAFQELKNKLQNKTIEINKLDVEKRRITNAELSAYTASADETDARPWETAMGTKTREGIIATNDESLMGKRVRINGKTYTIEDKLGPRYREQFKKTGKLMFDIVMGNKKEARQFGRKQSLVEILD